MALVAAAGVAWLWPALLPLVLAADAAFVALFLWDAWRTPSPRAMEVVREAPETAGLSLPLVRVVRIRPPKPWRERAAGLRVEVHEEFPETFTVLEVERDGASESASPEDPSGGPDRGTLPASRPLELRRSYRPELRGSHALGDLRLRLRGPLGLVQRQARLRGIQMIAVEPALADLKNTLRLAASERWQDLGVRRLRRRGGETEFESLRDYVRGDDPRRIDWKAFARRGKPTVRQYQEERGQELILLLDCGRRMRAIPSEGHMSGWTKLDWALDAALQLAAVALARGDRVGALAFGPGLLAYVAPAKSARQLQRLREAMFHLQPTDRESDPERALRELAVRHRRRALVLMVGDVADPFTVGHQRRALASASRRHRVLFTALDDPQVRHLAEAADTEPAVRAAAFELIEDRRRALRDLRGSGVRVLDAVPAEAAGPMLAAWLDERRRA